MEKGEVEKTRGLQSQTISNLVNTEVLTSSFLFLVLKALVAMYKMLLVMVCVKKSEKQISCNIFHLSLVIISRVTVCILICVNILVLKHWFLLTK